MTKIVKLIFGLCLFFAQTSWSQIENKTLKSEAKMRESDSPVSNTLYTISAGTQVKTFGLTGGYYKVEYNGEIGYINELFFQNSGINNNNSSSPSQSYSSTPNTTNVTETGQWTAQSLYSEEDYRKYFIENIYKIDPIEGIWSISYSEDFYEYERFVEGSKNLGTRKVAIIKTNNIFELKELNSYESSTATFESTASNVYLYKNKQTNYNTYAYLKNNGVLIEYEKIVKGYDDDEKKSNRESGFSYAEVEEHSKHVKRVFSFSLLKVFPSAKEMNNNNIANQKSSGTGFAINNEGLIATNYHVIDNAKQIHIKGINGDFSKSYQGTIVTYDKNNDLAIIKITDATFSSFGTIPYLIKQTTTDIGVSVNVLGYPLITTMGEEIKYTNGTISSKSGFQGDITSYQISAPIQPGNSGGPLFDKSGNIIGIVNAKHNEAENVGYAVKSSYLLSLIETLPTLPKLQIVNSINNKSLPEQIKSIKNFVYIIEIN